MKNNYTITSTHRYSDIDGERIIFTVQLGHPNAFVDVMYKIDTGLLYIMDAEDGSQVYNSDGDPIPNAYFDQEKVMSLVTDESSGIQTKYAVISVYTGYSYGVGMPQVEYFDDEEKAVKRLKEIWNQALDNQLAFDEEEDILPWRKLEHSEDWHAAKLWRPTEDRDIEDDYFAVWVVPVRN